MFNIGDRVRCINPGMNWVNLGEEYTVTNVNLADGMVYLNNLPKGVYTRRFELVEVVKAETRKSIMEIKIGADPELFITQQGKFRSAHGVIPGTKAEPFKVNKGAVQVDGMALEFNIDPANTADEFVTNVTTVMAEMKAMVPDYDFALVPSAKFNGNHFRMQPEEAKELGCEPDYNAYTMEENPRPDNTTTMRTAAGHVHIGFCEGADIRDPDHMQRCATLVKQLDCYLGIPSLLWDRDVKRRSMYGKAGAFRPKSYGVEYRVLSNSWLRHEDLMRFVFNNTKLAVDQLMAGNRPFSRASAYGSGTMENAYRNLVDCSDSYAVEHYITHGYIPGIGMKQVRELQRHVA